MWRRYGQSEHTSTSTVFNLLLPTGDAIVCFIFCAACFIYACCIANPTNFIYACCIANPITPNLVHTFFFSHDSPPPDSGRSGGRLGVMRVTPCWSVAKGIVGSFLLTWAEIKKLGWSNISVRGKHQNFLIFILEKIILSYVMDWLPITRVIPNICRRSSLSRSKFAGRPIKKNHTRCFQPKKNEEWFIFHGPSSNFTRAESLPVRSPNFCMPLFFSWL